ncbi:MAG: glycine--tRNA ligase [Verrucomicrobiales bacterium]|jgi:glycyl-tRNA synthetase|nr:glycine--tRNA ligase [Verrucomicrobiales bacterium]
MAENNIMEKIAALCKRRGFIFQSSEIYGGLNGFWDYGQLGAELKRNLRDTWWRAMTREREDVEGLDAAIIMHPNIWKASGHTETFADPMVDCKTCKGRFRADQLAQIPCPQKSSKPVADCDGEKTGARPFNLMFQTYTGPIQSEENIAYLRPETAQAIFVQFKNVLESSRQKLPFGICQIGKAFRNEINPRNYIFRSREFEQMELEFFIKPDEVIEKIHGSVAKWHEGADLSTPQPNWGWEMWHRYWVDQRVKYYESIGLGRDALDFYWQKKEELAHYAKATVDILFKFPFGTEELEGIAARGNYDLTQHSKFVGKPQDYFDEDTKTRYIPHVIEPSAGLDRLALAVITNAYHEETITDAKGKTETRVIMRFHPRIAPFKAGVFPLLKNKPELVAKAREVHRLLKPHMNCFYDEAGSIGRRYARQDEAGTPFCVTVDFETLEGVKDGADSGKKDTVTLRHRDTSAQERVSISDLLGKLLPAIS